MPAPAASWTRSEIQEVSAWEKAFLTFIHDRKPEIQQKIIETKDLDNDTMATLNAAIEQFQKQFAGRGDRRPGV